MPEIKAKFILDNEGNPKQHVNKGERHYEIELWMSNVSEEAYSVTYELDESYYDRIREVKDRAYFSFPITSYGDYEVKAIIRSKKSIDATSKDLYEALKETHGLDKNAQVVMALDDIKRN